MSGIIKNISILLLITVYFCGCKHYAPFPELDDDGTLKADSENVAYDNTAPIIGSKEASKVQNKSEATVSKKTAEVKPKVKSVKDESKAPEKKAVKVSEDVKTPEKAKPAAEPVKPADPVVVKTEEKKDLSKPNPEVANIVTDEPVFVVPGKTTPSVITDMDLTEMDAEDGTIRTKIIKPVSETKTILPVKKEIREVKPKKEASSEPSVFYLADTIYFNNGGSAVDSQYYSSLRKIVKEAKTHNGKIVVQGFASSRTRNADMMTHKMANLKVSVARAENVADLLVKYGMPRSKIITEGLSDSRPAYLEVMPEGERLNRRAEIYISY